MQKNIEITQYETVQEKQPAHPVQYVVQACVCVIGLYLSFCLFSVYWGQPGHRMCGLHVLFLGGAKLMHPTGPAGGANDGPLRPLSSHQVRAFSV